MEIKSIEGTFDSCQVDDPTSSATVTNRLETAGIRLAFTIQPASTYNHHHHRRLLSAEAVTAALEPTAQQRAHM